MANNLIKLPDINGRKLPNSIKLAYLKGKREGLINGTAHTTNHIRAILKSFPGLSLRFDPDTGRLSDDFIEEIVITAKQRTLGDLFTKSNAKPYRKKETP